MDNSHDNEMIQDLFNNLIEILHASVNYSNANGQTNPVPNKPDLPASNIKKAQKNPSPHYTSDSPENPNKSSEMAHLSSDNSGDNDKTNPFPNKPDHPTVDGKNARKTPSMQHSYLGDISEFQN